MAEQQLIERPQDLPTQDQPQPESHPKPQTPPAVAPPPQPNPQPAPAVGNGSGVVQQLKKERERAQKELKSFDAAIAALGILGSDAQPAQSNPHSASAVAPPLRLNSQAAPPVAGHLKQTRNLQLSWRNRPNQTGKLLPRRRTQGNQNPHRLLR
jgi:hypothetical protein